MDPHQLKISTIGVVMLGVQSLGRSISFYRDELGLTLNFQSEGFAFLNAGGVTLCLSEPLAKALGSAPGAVELVFSVESVREAHQALESRAIRFTREPRVVTGTNWAANFDDPDGHHLSIFGLE
jgi:catechol 2,3-dioxygenase-like lactoylglutathione lyase family enzyme